MGRFVALACVLSASVALANEIKDGDFDALSAGSRPDLGYFAGAWGFTQDVIDDSSCEWKKEQVSIVDTDEFEPGATGQSLAIRVAGDSRNRTIHVVNEFAKLKKTEHPIVLVRFDIWVGQDDSTGGSVYLSTDRIRLSVRSSQIAWGPNGVVDAVGRNSDGTARFIRLVDDAPRGVWQSWFLRVDQKRRLYDAYWAPRGESLALAKKQIDFRGYYDVAHVNRFVFAFFGELSDKGEGYLDNVNVFFDRSGDLNCDDAVDFDDIDAFVIAISDVDAYSAEFPYCNRDNADVNNDDSVDFSDIDAFIECLIAGGC